MPPGGLTVADDSESSRIKATLKEPWAVAADSVALEFDHTPPESSSWVHKP
jgi:hypothetical protein